MQTWSQVGLFLVVVAKWFGGKVLADDLAELCNASPEVCEALLAGNTRFLKLSSIRTGGSGAKHVRTRLTPPSPQQCFLL